jgi:hypothetical protein
LASVSRVELPDDAVPDAEAEAAPRSYWQRYGDRWKRSFYVLAAIGAVVVAVERIPDLNGPSSVVGLLTHVLVGAIADGLLFGSLVCLVIAIPRSRDTII